MEMDRSTVYRCLGQLRDAGLVDTVHTGDGTARYEAASADHLHVACQVCGAAIHAVAPKFMSTARQVAARAGLSLADQSLTLMGTCRDCALADAWRSGEMS